jgi:hypothetical protein
MMILCKVGDVETAIVGYGPGKNGPQAIVPWMDKEGQYTLKAVPLSECQILNLPPKIEKKLKKLFEIRHNKALENTKKVAEMVIDPNNPGGQVLQS